MNRIMNIQQELSDQKSRRTMPSRPAKKYSGSKNYSIAKTPAAAGLFGIAGLTAVEAANLGLAGASLLQPVMTKSGNLTIVSDKTQRLLTPQARQQLGSIPKKTYTYPLLWINFDKPLFGAADALIEVTWEGNNYGEIGGAYVRRNLQNTTAFTKTSLNVSFTKLEKIPPHQMKDPREWPVVFAYDGTFDPWGNGQFEFQGEFEINAFGGLRFTRHEVKSVSLADWALWGKPENIVKKKSDRYYRVPPLPQKQREYLLQEISN